VVMKQLFDNLSLCIIHGYYSKNIHNLTSTQMFIKKNSDHRIYEKKINSQSTVVHSCLMKTKNQSPTPFQDKAGIFKTTVLCRYSQFYLIWFVQSSHLYN
jgi:hypothetical protein